MNQIPQAYQDIIWKFVSSLAVILAGILVNRVLSRLLNSRQSGQSHMHTLRMLVRNAIFITGGVIILAIWLGLGSSFTMAMGILGAGIAFASQEVIGSFAGFINIVSGNLYQIGDRVRIGDVIGDVLDISIMRTTVMEIGEWVKADQYTGRVVTVANRIIFSSPVFNYTKHWKYLWDEITIPITYGSNWHQAAEIMLAHGQEYTANLQEQAESGLKEMRKHYPILEDLPVQPTLYILMTDNWIEMTLRYVVEVQKRRRIKAELHYELLEHFSKEEKIMVASTTVEIVGFPPLQRAQNNSMSTDDRKISTEH
jgi:small-conductance mechanosensitive channel